MMVNGECRWCAFPALSGLTADFRSGLDLEFAGHGFEPLGVFGL
jgi:hypothetical protein